MKNYIFKSMVMAGAAATTLGAAGGSLAQSGIDYPNRPITLALATEGPGSVDTEYRLHVAALRRMPNPPELVIDYKGGAGGAVGAQYVARANPDGYTLLGTASSFVTLPLVNKSVNYDANKDFTPIMLVTKRFFMILVHPAAPFKTFPEYMAYVKAHPGELFWSSTGAGSSTQMPGLLLHSSTHTKVTDVFYKKASERLTDLMAGRVNVTAGTTLASAAYVRSGKLHAIAVTGDERSQLMPDIPTVAEMGVKDYEYSSWLGLLAPANLPTPITDKVNGWFKLSSTDANVKARMVATDTKIVASTPAGFKKFLLDETRRLGDVVKTAGNTAAK